MIRPVSDGHISSEYGPRNITIGGIKYTFHAGIDIGPSKENTHPGIVSPLKGLLYVFGFSNTFGNRVWIKITEGEYKGLFLVLAHMKELNPGLKPMQNIEEGTYLGIMGSTGLSKAVHAHLGLRTKPTDPEDEKHCPNPILIRKLYP